MRDPLQSVQKFVGEVSLHRSNNYYHFCYLKKDSIMKPVGSDLKTPKDAQKTPSPYSENYKSVNVDLPLILFRIYKLL